MMAWISQPLNLPRQCHWAQWTPLSCTLWSSRKREESWTSINWSQEHHCASQRPLLAVLSIICRFGSWWTQTRIHLKAEGQRAISFTSTGGESNIMGAWILRIKVKDLLKAKRAVGTDKSTKHCAHGHQNQTWQFVRLLAKSSFSIDFSTDCHVNTRKQTPYLHINSIKDVIQMNRIQYLQSSSIRSELLPGSLNQSNQTDHS